ncbi:hypothetical protein BH11MYX2_BH11MYX2_33080 [soil metagenome]
MPLDWEPLPTAKRGHEAEYESLFKKLAHARPDRRDQLTDWFSQVAVPTFETIGAPRVGYDDAANEWLLKRAQKSNRTDAEVEELKVEMHGYYVLEIMPPCDGFPVYSNHLTSEHLERYAFNAELLLPLQDILGTELWRLVQTAHLAADHMEIGKRLDATAQKFVTDNKLADTIATIREPVFPEGSAERKAHILFAAAKWCTYWAARGYGLAPVG